MNPKYGQSLCIRGGEMYEKSFSVGGLFKGRPLNFENSNWCLSWRSAIKEPSTGIDLHSTNLSVFTYWLVAPHKEGTKEINSLLLQSTAIDSSCRSDHGYASPIPSFIFSIYRFVYCLRGMQVCTRTHIHWVSFVESKESLGSQYQTWDSVKCRYRNECVGVTRRSSLINWYTLCKWELCSMLVWNCTSICIGSCTYGKTYAYYTVHSSTSPKELYGNAPLENT